MTQKNKKCRGLIEWVKYCEFVFGLVYEQSELEINHYILF